MKLFIPSFVWWRIVVLLIFIGAMLGIGVLIYKTFSVDKNFSTTLTGVHHLGSDYYIKRFYINKGINDSVGEGGGGGSNVCCLSLPKKWSPELTADVRWEVIHILRAPDATTHDTGEVEGIYRAQVPIEPYAESGSFYVHFFPEKRVRIVVSDIPSNGEGHPAKTEGTHAGENATMGYRIETMFTDEEIAEARREIDRDRKKYGDWR
ncbi:MULTISPECIES: DUF3304 domain-containing protein [Massilia]|uniref:DUF3304 domain-containing protein n=1 Tax=Massilia TaxID=149698 RepID=UPI001C62F0BF|nr:MULTISPECIES: DUF3304 domain-containing protein [Massilia]QYG03832.1 DUF3304 domain-containing protein [Massilia sp. NP310]